MSHGNLYLAVDPGGTCGWAIFDELTGKPLSFGEVERGPAFFSFLVDTPVSFYVVENFRIRPATVSGFAHEWNPALTARDIGAIEFWAHKTGRPIVYQEPSIKAITAKRFGLPNKGKHSMDAVLHGCYYAWKELGLAPTEHEEQRQDSSGGGVRRPARVALISGYSGLRKAGSKASLQVPKDGV